MLYLEQYKNTNPILTLTWNSNWISDLESPWSIFEKIKYCNHASKSDLFSVFGNEKVLSQKTIMGKRNHDFYALFAFDDDKLMDSIGFRLKQYNLDCLLDISGFLYKNDIHREYFMNHAAIRPYHYFRENLHFCLACMKAGYHSILHQFKLIHQCPFHLTQLLNSCPQCHTSIPYELSDAFFQSPFVCNCGYTFMDDYTPYHREWGTIKYKQIQDIYVNRWLTLSEEEKLVLSRVHLYERNDLDKAPSLLKFLLGIINKNTTENDSSNIKISNSPIIQKVDHRLKNASDSVNNRIWPIENWFQLESYQSNPIISRFLTEVAQSSNSAMKSISKYLRNTLLTRHKSCIKRFIKISKEKGRGHPPICPFAYAYVMWKKSLWGIPRYYDVENEPFYRDGSTLQKISSVCDNDYIVDLLLAWIHHYPIKNELELNRLKWMIVKGTGYLAFQHFKTWLKKAPAYAAKLEIAFETDIMDDEKIVFAFALPKDPTLSISFFCEPGEDDLNWLEDAGRIICPYSTIKKRKKKPTEISHHPMRLAINNF